MTKPEHDTQSDKTPAEIEDRIWELAKKIDICMLTTWDGHKQRSRPLSARIDRAERRIHFLVDVEGHKNEEIAHYPAVSCSFVDSGGHKYVVVSGEAHVANDRAKIAELWTDFDRAWWEDASDPDIRLLSVTPEHGELWDSPNRLVSAAKLAFAAVTGQAPEFGETAQVRL
jgi:general stress protein 26